MNARVRQVTGTVTAVAGAALFSAVSLVGQAPAPARPAAAPAAAAAPVKEDLSVIGYVAGYKAPRINWFRLA